MALWTDIVDPATLTGYARAALADYEAQRGTLARWLPNRDVPNINVRFIAGSAGLQEEARFRAYDAEIEIGKRPTGKRVTLELPALGQNLPVSEYEQLRAQGITVDEAAALVAIQTTTRQAVRAVADRIERLRGTVLYSGKATISQDNFVSDDDFGRSAGHTLTAPALWNVAATDRLTQLTTWSDLYADDNGMPPGALLMSTRVARALAAGDQFQTQLLNSGARPATLQEVQDILTAAGLPLIYLYDRRVNVAGVTNKALTDDAVILLPAPVATDDWMGTELGATFWGRTLTSTEGDWGIEPSEQPGVVAGVFRNEKPPMGIEVISDGIALPVMANADLSLRAKVL
jgi:hypothetical protein